MSKRLVNANAFIDMPECSLELQDKINELPCLWTDDEIDGGWVTHYNVDFLDDLNAAYEDMYHECVVFLHKHPSSEVQENPELQDTFHRMTAELNDLKKHIKELEK